MDSDPLGIAAKRVPRKNKFAPVQPRKLEKKPILPKVEKLEEAAVDEAKAQELLKRFNEASTRAKVKNEKKVQARVAFGTGDASSMRSYGTPKGGIGINRSEGAHVSGPGQVPMKEYKEPWDYYSYYPVTLPLRRPYSGNPELLDEQEFGEATENMGYEEDAVNSAEALGLMEENLEPSMLFLQLPANMPLTKQALASAEGHESVESKPLKGGAKSCSLDELPAGFMGKMLVYKSGAVKLKLGDMLYDVSSGLNCTFAQDVAAVNVEEKHCCVVGELNKRAIITPDMDSIINNMPNL